MTMPPFTVVSDTKSPKKEWAGLDPQSATPALCIVAYRYLSCGHDIYLHRIGDLYRITYPRQSEALNHEIAADIIFGEDFTSSDVVSLKEIAEALNLYAKSSDEHSPQDLPRMQMLTAMQRNAKGFPKAATL